MQRSDVCEANLHSLIQLLNTMFRTSYEHSSKVRIKILFIVCVWAENAYFIFTNLIKVGSKSDIKQRKFDFYIYWDDTADKKVS